MNVAQVKAELVIMLCNLFGQPFDDRNQDDFEWHSIREITFDEILRGKKLLIEGCFYLTEEIWQISKLHRDVFCVEDISEQIGISVLKVKPLAV